MMQGWLFFHDILFWTKPRAQALLTSIPKGRMVILDLMSELDPQFDRFDSYFGQPYIWCMLHNFGGTLGMHGTARRINENVFIARNASDSSMIGIGVTMEGLNPNYALYDLMLEMGWRDEPANLSTWFHNYSTRRYGQDIVHLNNMWQLLKRSVYDYKGIIQQHGHYIIVRRPSLVLQPDVWYNTADVMEAWDEVLEAVEANPSLAQVETFKHDLVDLTRQALQLNIDYMYLQVVDAYKNRDKKYLMNATSTFLELMGDIDKILASNKWFLLSSWLEAAKQKASSSQEQIQFEEMARNQITLWGPNGEIRDYACKQWAYLMADFYTPRWAFFFEALIAAVVDKKPFNQHDVNKAIFRNIEKPFTINKKLYPPFEIEVEDGKHVLPKSNDKNMSSLYKRIIFVLYLIYFFVNLIK